MQVEIAKLPIYGNEKKIRRRRNFASALNFTNAITTILLEIPKAKYQCVTLHISEYFANDVQFIYHT